MVILEREILGMVDVKRGEKMKEELETIILATCPRSFTTKQSREMEQMLERGMADWGCGGGA